MTKQTPSRVMSRPLAVLLKTLVGVMVFSVSVGGWAAFQSYVKMHEPLPNGQGRQGRCVLWFVGSSSIYRWTTLADDMAPWITRNRGVAGAFLPELRQRFANENAPVLPDAIIFYGGDNDIANGETATAAISIKPSPARWLKRPVQLAFDQTVRDTARHTRNLTFVDASAGLLVGGQPGPFFEKDRIHLSAAGYRVWAASVHDALVVSMPRGAVNRCMNQRSRSTRGE
jgi:lysophospholipase L1-like esterase